MKAKDKSSRVVKKVLAGLSKKVCKYPGCINYKKGAKEYCCMGCFWGALDWNRLRVGKNSKKSRSVK